MRNSKNSILCGFKGHGKNNLPFQEILKGVYDVSKIDNNAYDIFSKKQVKCFLNNIIKENTGVSKEIQKSVVAETREEFNKLIPITLKKGDKLQQFFISKKGECKEILKAFAPVNDDEDYFEDDDFDEEEVLDFIKNNKVDDDALIDEFGDDIIDYVNQLHEDGKIDVDEENGVYVVKDSSNDDDDDKDDDDKDDDDDDDKKELDDKESDLDDKKEEDKEKEEEKVADEDTKEEDEEKNKEKAKDDEDAEKDELGKGDDLKLKSEEIGDRFEDKEEKDDKEEKTDLEEKDQAKEDLDKEDKDLNSEEDEEKKDLDENKEDLDDKDDKNIFENEGNDLNENDRDDLNLNDKDDLNDNEEDDHSDDDKEDNDEVEDKEDNDDEYSPEELEKMAKKTATTTLIKFYKNSNDENKKDIAKLELKIRGIDVDTLDEEHHDKDENNLPETREDLKKLESWMANMFGDYDSEDLREYVSGLVMQSPAKTKELKNHYRDFYKMTNAGNTLAKVDNEEFKTWLTDTYLKNFSDGDLQSYALSLVSKNPIEYNKLKKTYKTYEENGML